MLDERFDLSDLPPLTEWDQDRIVLALVQWAEG